MGSGNASAFIDHAYDKLGVLSVLDHNRSAGSAFAPLLPDRKRETPKCPPDRLVVTAAPPNKALHLTAAR
jgi:hypothetical protein